MKRSDHGNCCFSQISYTNLATLKQVRNMACCTSCRRLVFEHVQFKNTCPVNKLLADLLLPSDCMNSIRHDNVISYESTMSILCDSAYCYMDLPLQSYPHKSALQCTAKVRQISNNKLRIKYRAASSSNCNSAVYVPSCGYGAPAA